MKASKHEYVRRQAIARLRVHISSNRDADGRRLAYLSVGSTLYRCALGRAGRTRCKREGDGATPVGSFRILEWRFRPGVRAGLVRKGVWRPIHADNGWCDDPRSGAYNRPVRLPFHRNHEVLLRNDGKYDVIGIMNYNIAPRKRGAGSAIFLHICDDDYGATAGCVALTRRDLRKILPRLASRVWIEIA